MAHVEQETELLKHFEFPSSFLYECTVFLSVFFFQLSTNPFLSFLFQHFIISFDVVFIFNRKETAVPLMTFLINTSRNNYPQDTNDNLSSDPVNSRFRIMDCFQKILGTRSLLLRLLKQPILAIFHPVCSAEYGNTNDGIHQIRSSDKFTLKGNSFAPRKSESHAKP